jgi:hypothetical protein
MRRAWYHRPEYGGKGTGILSDMRKEGSRSRAVRTGAFLTALLSFSCYDFRGEGPEDPSPVVPPGLVSVAIEYRQPNGCVNSAGRCGDPVVFFGSWMREGQEITLSPVAGGGRIWVGTAHSVPVNFPPREYAHTVRIFDPHILDHATLGVTAERLWVGRQLLIAFDAEGTPAESALVYVDANGFGHNPF